MVAGNHNLNVAQQFVEKSDDLVFHGLNPNTAVEISKQGRLLQDCCRGLRGSDWAEGLPVYVQQHNICPAIDGTQYGFKMFAVRQGYGANYVRLRRMDVARDQEIAQGLLCHNYVHRGKFSPLEGAGAKFLQEYV